MSRRLRLALAEYGLGFELIEQKPWEPDPALYGLNAAGAVPVLVTDAGEPLSGIEAVSEYLEETREDRPSLIPGTPLQRAEIRRLTGWFDTKFYAEVSEPVLTEKAIRRFLPREAGGGGMNTARVREAMVRLRNHLDYIGHLADRRTWLAGDQLSIADLAAAAHISAVDYFGDIPWADYPVAKSWYQRMKSRPSFRSLLGDTVRGMAPAGHYADLDF